MHHKRCSTKEGALRITRRIPGAVNGVSACQFQVTAWDDSFSNGNVTKLDAFGIYSCNSGGDGNGNRYSIDPTPLTEGSIIIHQ